MRTLTRKGYARIYVQKPEHIEVVREMIRRMDEFEYEYLPDKLVAEFSEYPEMCFTHKFDALDVDDLAVACWKAGVPILIIDNGCIEFLPPRETAL